MKTVNDLIDDEPNPNAQLDDLLDTPDPDANSAFDDHMAGYDALLQSLTHGDQQAPPNTGFGLAVDSARRERDASFALTGSGISENPGAVKLITDRVSQLDQSTAANGGRRDTRYANFPQAPLALPPIAGPSTPAAITPPVKPAAATLPNAPISVLSTSQKILNTIKQSSFPKLPPPIY